MNGSHDAPSAADKLIVAGLLALLALLVLPTLAHARNSLTMDGSIPDAASIKILNPTLGDE